MTFFLISRRVRPREFSKRAVGNVESFQRTLMMQAHGWIQKCAGHAGTGGKTAVDPGRVHSFVMCC